MFQDFTIFLRIHDSLDYVELSRSWGWKASPDLNIPTTMLHCWEKVLLVVCSVDFSPNMAVLVVTKQFNFGLICPQNGLPKSFRFLQVLSGKVETGSFVLFCEQRLLPSNPSMKAMLIEFSSYCGSMHMCPRCSKRGLQIPRCYVWVGFYLNYHFSCGSCWYFRRSSTSRQGCSLFQCSPFVDDLPHGGTMKLRFFWDDFIAFPRQMCCHYPLPEVLWDLSSSRHDWPVWVHLGKTKVTWFYLCFNQWCAISSLNISHFIGPFQWLI